MLPIYLLSAAGFTVLTTEFIIVGLLPPMARDLGVSISRAGLLVTLFAFTVAALGPFLTAWCARFERKRLFIAVLLLFALSNLLAALAPDYTVMMFARLLPALALPVFWSLASETVVTIAGPERAGRAVARFGTGIILAMIFGIPLGTLISDVFGWRSAFAVIGALALLKALLLLIWLPSGRPATQASMAAQLGLLRNPMLLAHVLLSVLVFSGMFTAYTYLADILERLAGFDGALVGWCLMGFGAVGLLGNAWGGRMVDRHPLLASLLFCSLLTIGLLAVVPSIGAPGALLVALVIWGVSQAALFLVCHVRLMKAAPQAPAFAASLNVAGGNLGIGLGALIGGRVIDSLGLANLGIAAAAIIGLAIVLALGMLRLDQAVAPAADR